MIQYLIKKQEIYATLWEGRWIDISRPWDILLANQITMNTWDSSIIPNSVNIEKNVVLNGNVVFGKNCRVKSGTTINGPCYIADNVFIGNNCLIRDYSCIGPDSVIGYGTEIKNSILFGKVKVGRLSFVGDSVFGEGVNFGTSCVTTNYKIFGKKQYTVIKLILH